MVVVTISGKAESGKDFTAILLKEELEAIKKTVLVIHYADYLKYICKQYFAWDGKKDLGGRALLQYVGTDLIRKKEPDFWVDVVCNLLKVIGNQYDYVLIPDTRFPNEVVKMKQCSKAISLKVERIDHENSLTAEQRAHPSEIALDDFEFDYVIKSASGRENLQYQVRKFIKEKLRKEK